MVGFVVDSHVFQCSETLGETQIPVLFSCIRSHKKKLAENCMYSFACLKLGIVTPND